MVIDCIICQTLGTIVSFLGNSKLQRHSIRRGGRLVAVIGSVSSNHTVRSILRRPASVRPRVQIFGPGKFHRWTAESPAGKDKGIDDQGPTPPFMSLTRFMLSVRTVRGEVIQLPIVLCCTAAPPWLYFHDGAKVGISSLIGFSCAFAQGGEIRHDSWEVAGWRQVSEAHALKFMVPIDLVRIRYSVVCGTLAAQVKVKSQSFQTRQRESILRSVLW